MSRALMIAGLGLMLSACQVVGPDYQVPDDAAIQRKDIQGELTVAGKPVVSAPVPADWWRLYQDPRLDQLVQQAMASNTDLRVAAANLQRARAQVDEAEAAGGWSGGVKMGAQRLQESGQAFLLPEKVPVANIADIGISASYQFDLWGTLPTRPRPPPIPRASRWLPTLCAPTPKSVPPTKSARSLSIPSTCNRKARR
jgi:outer membrane protein TolC